MLTNMLSFFLKILREPIGNEIFVIIFGMCLCFIIVKCVFNLCCSRF